MIMQLSDNNREELLYTRHLADVEVSIRIKALKKLKKYLHFKSSNQGLTSDGFIKIWKGLYYCIYMADKPLVQEELAEKIGLLIHEICGKSQRFLFCQSALETFSREWDGIDNFRMDKFMMFFTRVVRQWLIHLRNNNWDKEEISSYINLFETIILCPTDQINSKPLGLKMHLTDIILEELGKIGKEHLNSDVIMMFLYPFFKVLVISKENRFVNYVQSRIFQALISQSDLGIQHQDDLTIGEFELEEGQDDDNLEKEENIVDVVEPLDPRAGGVDVYVPQLKPNYKQIADIFLALGSMKEITEKKRKFLYKQCADFLDLEMEVYPYKEPTLKVKEVFNTSTKKLVNQGVKELMEFEEKLKGEQPLDLSFGRGGKKRNPWFRHRMKLKPENPLKVDLELEVNKTLSQVTQKLRLPQYSFRPEIPIDDNMKVASTGEIGQFFDQSLKTNEEQRKGKKKKRKKASEKATLLETKMDECGTTLKRKLMQPEIKKGMKLEQTLPSGNFQPNGQMEMEDVSNHNEVGENMKKPDCESDVLGQTKKKRKKRRKSIENLKLDIDNAKLSNDENKLEKCVGGVTEGSSQQLKTKLSDPWSEPLQIGEKEFFIANRKYMKKMKKKRETMKLIQKREKMKIIQKRKKMKNIQTSGKCSSSMDLVIKKTAQVNTRGKTLKINLRENKEHTWGDYRRIVNESPALPFSAHKKPKSSALKNISIRRPIKKVPHPKIFQSS